MEITLYNLLLLTESSAAKSEGIFDKDIDLLTVKELKSMYKIISFRLQSPKIDGHIAAVVLFELSKRKLLLVKGKSQNIELELATVKSNVFQQNVS